MNKKIYADFGYLILLAASFGAVFVLGAIVAPVIFHTDRLAVDLLIDHYNEGVIMSEIFLRFSYFIYFLAFSVALYEAVMYKTGQRDKTLFYSAFLVVATSLMFSGVYVPKILELQAMGREATTSDTFDNLHIASEIDFKILAAALIVLFIRRLMLLRRS
ncbi:DUF4149 domain-containing protein [Sulfurimonas sp. HSL-1716]|uniref:DUF4149 domain-containing protein n=1 Tax=Hydrocurvibacter sulfurireducens TaxID=3131937 RepID=UPI0031F81C73